MPIQGESPNIPTLRVLQPQSPPSARGVPTLRVLRWHRRQKQLQQESHESQKSQETHLNSQENDHSHVRRPVKWFMLLATSLFGCSALSLVLALVLSSATIPS